METDRLLRIVKKYKKWFETYSLNPFAYEVNGHSFYVVIYNKNNNVMGEAVISLDSKAKKEEYLEAFPWLIIFSVYSTNIFDIFGNRSKINSDFFFDYVNAVNKYLSQTSEVPADTDPLIVGRNIFEEVGKWQKKIIEKYKAYEDYYDNGILKRNLITRDDVEFTMQNMAEMNLYQYYQGKTIYERFKELKAFEQEFNNRKLEQYVPSSSKDFLKKLLDDTKTLEEMLKDFKLEQEVSHLSFEEQIQKVKDSAYENGFELVEKMKKKLRHPSL